MTTQTATAQNLAYTTSPVDTTDSLEQAMKSLTGLLWAKSIAIVPVSFNGQDYSAILVEVAHNGKDVGKLEISATARKVNSRDVYYVRMRLIDWNLPRANDDWFFMPKAMRPDHVASYANCFMNLYGLTPIALAYYMMERTRFFDNSCKSNRHTIIVHSLSNNVITVGLKLYGHGVCTLTVETNKSGETVMLLKDSNGDVLTQYTYRFKPWDVRTHLNNIFCDY